MGEMIIAVLTLLGGLALFLYGMTIMGGNLEKLAGGKMQRVLEKVTSNIFISVLFGMVVTAAIQSSSATTVMVVGLVNAGIFKLKQAVGVIMGANIGTTITAQILRLADLDGSSNFLAQMLSPKFLTPIIAIIGILFFMVAKDPKKKSVGQILLGFGILFTGMFAMEGAITPYRDAPFFTELFATLTNPVFGVLAGCFVTVLIQSSSASIGILQALSVTGQVTFANAFPIIMGQNIGTCITPILSSLGANRNAKRAAMVHLWFNVIGTTLFLAVVYGVHALLPELLPFWNGGMGRGEIANFHTIFNVSTTLLMIPFASKLEKLATWTVRNAKVKTKQVPEDAALLGLDPRFLSTPSIAIGQGKKLLAHMAGLVQENYTRAIDLLQNYDESLAASFREKEDRIDIIEDRLGNYVVMLPVKDLSPTESHNVTEILQLINEFERMGDYAMNVVEKIEYMQRKNSFFSAGALQEIRTISDAVSEILSMAVACYTSRDNQVAMMIEPLEQTIDELEARLKKRHINRLKSSECSIDAGVAFLEILTFLERIADHCSNVAISVLSADNGPMIESHEYVKRLHEGKSQQYQTLFENYREKYVSQLANKTEK